VPFQIQFFVQLCSRWQCFNWTGASRCLTATAEVLVHCAQCSERRTLLCSCCCDPKPPSYCKRPEEDLITMAQNHWVWSETDNHQLEWHSKSFTCSSLTASVVRTMHLDLRRPALMPKPPVIIICNHNIHEINTSLCCRWQTRAMQCLRPTVLYTDVDSQCDKLVTETDISLPHWPST